MPNFYTSVIFLINQSEEIGEKQFMVFGFKEDQKKALNARTPLWVRKKYNFQGWTQRACLRGALEAEGLKRAAQAVSGGRVLE